MSFTIPQIALAIASNEGRHEPTVWNRLRGLTNRGRLTADGEVRAPQPAQYRTSEACVARLLILAGDIGLGGDDMDRFAVAVRSTMGEILGGLQNGSEPALRLTFARPLEGDESSRLWGRPDMGRVHAEVVFLGLGEAITDRNGDDVEVVESGSLIDGRHAEATMYVRLEPLLRSFVSVNRA